MSAEVLDDAYCRLRSTGPEFDGWLSNHGPMAAEALARHGHQAAIGSWLDRYCQRLEAAPTPSGRVEDWAAALGDAGRLGDWLGHFEEQLRERAWLDVLRVWWPRLLPGIAAGATHGVIRVGHAVRVLREDGETPARLTELAQGLGYWAARWQPVPGAVTAQGILDPSAALSAVPRIPHQSGRLQERLAQLDQLAGWEPAQRALSPSADVPQLLRGLVSAAVRGYATRARGNPVMLVHVATAPNAVLRTLPSLPEDQWAASAAAVWSASAAIYSAYAPASGGPEPVPPPTAADAFDLSAWHGDEHVIKLADTALDVHRWTGDGRALAAVATAAALIDRD